MNLQDKLEILADSAKYDVACTSSGASRQRQAGVLGNTHMAGLCHSFAADGRCITLLKVLMSNYCTFDCGYCVNRRSNDVPRAVFTPKELADLTIGFYRRNYIEGLFLSSGVLKNADYTMERMIECIRILRQDYRFGGYIHAKAIPGSSPEMITRLGLLVDRISVNLELPSEKSLVQFCPDKPKHNILAPMGHIKQKLDENSSDMVVYNHAPQFASAGQSTQMIIGASPESDFQIVRLAESLYHKYELKRVFYSAYIPIGTHALLPKNQPVPLLREHRLYQADWLLRYYGFAASEILSEQHPDLDPLLDPKCQWALRNLDQFPVEIKTADLETLLRVPGIGPIGARKIVKARKMGSLSFEDLKKMGIVLKRAAYFITSSGKIMPGVKIEPSFIYNNLTADTRRSPGNLPLAFGSPAPEAEQLSLFPSISQPALLPSKRKLLSGEVPL